MFPIYFPYTSHLRLDPAPCGYGVAHERKLKRDDPVKRYRGSQFCNNECFSAAAKLLLPIVNRSKPEEWNTKLNCSLA